MYVFFKGYINKKEPVTNCTVTDDFARILVSFHMETLVYPREKELFKLICFKFHLLFLSISL